MTHGSALWFEMVAMGPLILMLTGSPAQLGIVLVIRTVASMAMGPIAGVVADAFKRKTILIVTKFPVMVLSSVFAVLVITGTLEVWHLYVFTIFRGITQAFDQPARSAMIPSIVPAHLVTNAVALNSGSQQATRIAGPAVGGVVVAFFGLGSAFVGVALLYVVAVIFTFMLRVPDHRRPGTRVRVGNFGSDFVEGLKYAWNTPTILGVVIIAMVYHTFGVNYLQIFGSIYAIQILDIGTRGLGFIMSAAGVGGIVGAFILATINPSRRRGLIMMSVLALYGVALMLYATGANLGSLPMLMGMAAVLGFLQAWVLPLNHSITLTIVPEHMRGRVLGLLALDRAMSAGGGALAGFMAAAIWPPLAQTFLGLGCLLSALVLLLFIPSLRRIH